MAPTEQAAKLAMIARLPEGELRGWFGYVCQRRMRPEFDGERAALMARARGLGIPLNEVSL